MNCLSDRVFELEVIVSKRGENPCAHSSGAIFWRLLGGHLEAGMNIFWYFWDIILYPWVLSIDFLPKIEHRYEWTGLQKHIGCLRSNTDLNFMNSYLRPFRGCWNKRKVAYHQYIWCKHWLQHEFWEMASLEAGFKICLCSLDPKIQKSRCGWGPYWGCLEFINDNMGYFEGTHVGTYLSLKKLSGLNSLVLRLLSIKPILYEKYQSSGGCSWGHVWGWDLNFSNSELLRLVVLFEQAKDCANNKV